MQHDPIELILAALRRLPKKLTLAKDREHYDTNVAAATKLAALVLTSDPDAKINVYPDPLVGTALCFEADVDYFAVNGIEDLLNVLGCACAFECLPTDSGKARIGVTFQNTWDIVGASDEAN